MVVMVGVHVLEGAMQAAKPAGQGRVLNRAARERALIEAAAKLFAAKGYDATTTREIAAVAGCAEGLISRYFKGKAGLLRALIENHFAGEDEEFRDDSPPAATLAEEIMRRVVWDVEHISDDHEFLCVIFPQLLLQPELAREVRQLGPGRHERIIADRLSQHSAFRSLPEEDQLAVAQLINAIGLAFGFWNPAMGEDRARAKERAISIAKILARAFT